MNSLIRLIHPPLTRGLIYPELFITLLYFMPYQLRFSVRHTIHVDVNYSLLLLLHTVTSEKFVLITRLLAYLLD